MSVACITPKVPSPSALVRTLAVASLVFAAIATISFFAVGVFGRGALIFAAFGSAFAIAFAVRDTFFGWSHPFPEFLVACSWLALFVGRGWILASLPISAGMLFLFLAPLLVVIALLWTATRLLRRPSLQSLLAAWSSIISLAFFLSVIGRL
jgi:hypothetical protein